MSRRCRQGDDLFAASAGQHPGGDFDERVCVRQSGDDDGLPGRWVVVARKEFLVHFIDGAKVFPPGVENFHFHHLYGCGTCLVGDGQRE